MILVVNNDPKITETVRIIFFKAGFHAYGTSYKGIEEYINSKRIDAIIFIDLFEAEPVRSVCRNIRRRYPKITTAATYREGYRDIITDALWCDCDIIESDDSVVTDILRKMIDDIKRKAEYDYGNQSIESVSLPLTSRNAIIHNCLCLQLTPIERSIIRFLLLIYPNRAPMQSVFECCFNPAVDSTVRNVATHISEINKKSIKLTGEKIITHIRGKGYTIEFQKGPFPDDEFTLEIRKIVEFFI